MIGNDNTRGGDMLATALSRGLAIHAIEVVSGKRYFNIRSVLEVDSGAYEIIYPQSGRVVTALINGRDVSAVEAEAR